MKFIETELAGAFLVDIEPIQDDRGFFARSFCTSEFAAHGLDPTVAQCNVSFNRRRGTVRGMHWQRPPFGEVKLVRCTAGSILDVIVDLRPESPTFLQHFAVELASCNHRLLYIPTGFAHGFQTLLADTEVYYQMSQPYVPAAAAGVRWNDPAVAIRWPEEVTVISERDSTYPDFQGARDARLALFSEAQHCV
jgi:dTDP-4-dehydrorhamnose 3,5-epimerase